MTPEDSRPGPVGGPRSGRSPVADASSAVTAFVGPAGDGPLDRAVPVTAVSGLVGAFGDDALTLPLGDAVRDFFDNGGREALVVRVAAAGADLTSADYLGDAGAHTGLHTLDALPDVDIVCLAAAARGTDVPVTAFSAALDYCVDRGAMLLVDPPSTWQDPSGWQAAVASLGISGQRARSAALYYPRLARPDAAAGDAATAPSGAVAGVYARTDVVRGVWKSPAGMGATIVGGSVAERVLDGTQTAALNAAGVNVLRAHPGSGAVVWGARTMAGVDGSDEYAYVAVRRTALFIEKSLSRGLQWTVFEPNAEPLWAEVRSAVGAFMSDLFRRGAFQGTSDREGWFVACDRSTMTQADIDAGVLILVVGFAPTRPAEFVVLSIRLLAGDPPPS